jgi:hypothetical protein
VTAVDLFTPDERNQCFTFYMAEVFDGFIFRGVHEVEVFNSIMGITSTAIGTDGFSIKLIRDSFCQILPLLTHLYNFIITSSSYPSIWKTAVVLPLPKTSFVSVLSVERILYYQLVASEEMPQYGYGPGKDHG